MKPTDIQAIAGASWDAVREFLGSDVVTLEHVSTHRPLGHDRGAFRIDLADRRSLKLRRFREPDLAASVRAILKELRDPQLPRALFLHQEILIEEWREGTPLAPDDRAVFREAGELLARWHARPSLGGTTLPRMTSTRRVREIMQAHLGELCGDGLLPPAEVGVLKSLISRHDPGHGAEGLRHGDFCGENMLRDAEGRLVVIDNEAMARGFLAHDLVRARYRWSPPPTAWEQFLEGYAVHRKPDLDPGEELFWTLRVLIKSAHVRSLRWGSDASAPLNALRQLLAGREPLDEQASSTAPGATRRPGAATPRRAPDRS